MCRVMWRAQGTNGRGRMGVRDDTAGKTGPENYGKLPMAPAWRDAAGKAGAAVQVNRLTVLLQCSLAGRADNGGGAADLLLRRQ